MTQKIFLIVDGHPMHKAKLVKEFVQANSQRELTMLQDFMQALFIRIEEVQPFDSLL